MVINHVFFYTRLICCPVLTLPASVYNFAQCPSFLCDMFFYVMQPFRIFKPFPMSCSLLHSPLPQQLSRFSGLLLLLKTSHGILQFPSSDWFIGHGINNR